MFQKFMKTIQLTGSNWFHACWKGFAYSATVWSVSAVFTRSSGLVLAATDPRKAVVPPPSPAALSMTVETPNGSGWEPYLQPSAPCSYLTHHPFESVRVMGLKKKITNNWFTFALQHCHSKAPKLIKLGWYIAGWYLGEPDLQPGWSLSDSLQHNQPGLLIGRGILMYPPGWYLSSAHPKQKTQSIW